MFIAPSAVFDDDRDRIAGRELERVRDALADQDAEAILVGELPAGADHQIAAELGFLVGLDPLADDRKVGPAVVQQPGELHAAEDVGHLARCAMRAP